jgi:hypothetical protein
MEFPPRSDLAEKSFNASAMVKSRKIGEQIDSLVMTVASPKTSSISSAATWSDALGVEDKRFTASVLTRIFDYASGASSGAATTRVGTSRSPEPVVSSAAVGPAS